MGIHIKLGMALVLLLLALARGELRPASPPLFQGLSVQEESGAPAPIGSPEWENLSGWGKDLRWSTIQLLKNVRRVWIRLSRLVKRSAPYWIGWMARTLVLLLFGGLLSAIDRRLLAQAWQQGVRTASTYAWIGLVVFLRLLRDPRVPGRLRLIIPLAIVYGIVSSSWLQTGSPLLDAGDEIAVMGLASRWFVRRCPESIIEQHAARARERLEAALPSSEQRS